ncbi:hypothetical protein BGW38_005044 [Lunasporangiospora selenospora]|uniref:Ataxin-10 homolog n=1 Tax=Lunasporangiospora selenospora TaxID=979761 RepID=A0A9P6KJ32_9FUNG|nr:hypothetical protein BGW38_005044 [Lunasporangiospora selenospora]
MLRAGIQALSNLVTGNETSKDHIWESFLEHETDPSLHLLCTLAAIEDEAIVFGTVMFCFNCIFESKERSALLLSTPAGCVLLRQLAIVSQETCNKENRQSFEMIYKLFDHLINFDLTRTILGALRQSPKKSTDAENNQPTQPPTDSDMPSGPGSEGVEETNDTNTADSAQRDPKSENHLPLSSEQVTFLKMLDSRIYVWHEKQQRLWNQLSKVDPSSAEATTLRSGLEPTLSLETVGFLTDTFGSISKLTIDVLKTLTLPGVGKRSVEDLSNLSTGVLLLLGCFSHLSQFEDGVGGHSDAVPGDESASAKDSNPDGQPLTLNNDTIKTTVPPWFTAQHKAMVEHNLVENAIELLRQADLSLARVVDPVPNANSPAPLGANSDSTLLSNTSTEQGQQMFFKGLKRDIVRVVGNMSHRSRNVQDRIRGCNGLIVMLNQCNIDDSNPYLREHAILALKNILAGNLENQAIIQELEPIDAVDHPVLREAKVSAQLDMETGKPVLKKI